MVSDMKDVLETCLARIELGELTPEECLALYPELSQGLRPLLAAAQKLEPLKQLAVRPEFRASGRARLLEHIRNHPRRRSSRFGPLALRYAASLATLVFALATAGTALAQQALPGDVLYSWKLASERVWRSIQSNRVDADLILADRRLNELHAIQGLPELEILGVSEYADLLRELRSDLETDQGRVSAVNQVLAAHKEALSDLFANSQADLPDPEELFSTIPMRGEEPPGKDNGSNGGTEIPLPVDPTQLEGDEVLPSVEATLPADNSLLSTPVPTAKLGGAPTLSVTSMSPAKSGLLPIAGVTANPTLAATAMPTAAVTGIPTVEITVLPLTVEVTILSTLALTP